MANQLGKFSSQLAQATQPLRELLSKTHAWHWGQAQETAFSQVKDELCKPTILAFYSPTAPTKVSADDSSHGLGAVLLQENGREWKPVAYASRCMSETEKRYAQIEKEALATVANYIIGLKIIIETDHKPLVPLFGTKNLDSLPPRILRFRLRLARFDYSVHIVRVSCCPLLMRSHVHLAQQQKQRYDWKERLSTLWSYVSTTSQPARNGYICTLKLS